MNKKENKKQIKDKTFEIILRITNPVVVGK